MKRIGLLTSLRWESFAAYYRLLNEESSPLPRSSRCASLPANPISRALTAQRLEFLLAWSRVYADAGAVKPLIRSEVTCTRAPCSAFIRNTCWTTGPGVP